MGSATRCSRRDSGFMLEWRWRPNWAWSVALSVSTKELLEGALYTTFIWSAPSLYAIALVYMAIYFGPMGLNGMAVIGLGLTPVLIAWYMICAGREKAELERLLKPTRFLTDDERHEAIKHLIKTHTQK